MNEVAFAIKLLGIKSECIEKLEPYLCGAQWHSLRDVFLDDPMCMGLCGQYMLGDKVMVVVTKPDARHIGFYLPKGTWTDIASGQEYRGMTYVKRDVDNGQCPILAFEDAVLPTQSGEYRLYTLRDSALGEAKDVVGRVISSLRARRLSDGVQFEATGAVSVLIVNAALAVRSVNCAYSIEKSGIRITPNAGVESFSIHWFGELGY